MLYIKLGWFFNKNCEEIIWGGGKDEDKYVYLMWENNRENFV